MLKEKELEVIRNCVNARGQMIGNAITLLANEDVTLRTNGVVVYGLYKHPMFGEKYVKFTHSTSYKKPYIASPHYEAYKDIINNVWRTHFIGQAREKYFEVVSYIKSLNGQTVKPQAKPEPKTEAPIIKEEVKMKSTNVMQLAHQLRKELKLEGHYHVQMSIALKLAWKQIKGQPKTCATFAPVVEVPVAPVPEAPIVEQEVNTEYDYIFAPVACDGKSYTYALKDKAGNVQGNTITYNGPNIKIIDINMKRSFKQLIGMLPKNTKVVLLGNSCLTLSKVDQAIIQSVKDKSIDLIIDVNYLNAAPSGDAI